MSDGALEIVPTRPSSALVGLAAGISDIVKAQTDYQRVCVALLGESDIVTISGRQFKTKSAWRKLAVAFGVNLEILSVTHERDEDGKIMRSEVIARAIAPNGRYADGYGACEKGERNFTHPGHDIPATAATRATNRAAADLFGMGEVSAEEIVDDETGEIRGPGRPAGKRGPGRPPKDRDGGTPDELKGISDPAVRQLVRHMERIGETTLERQLLLAEVVTGHRVERLSLLTTAEYNEISRKLDEYEREQKAAARAAAPEQNEPQLDYADGGHD